MTDRDAEAIASLMPDLGYEATPTVVLARFQQLMKLPGERILIARLDEQIVGLCHAKAIWRLDSDGYGEIMTLVVRAGFQRQGIGRVLVQEASKWIFATGFKRVRLGSGVHRVDAHRFYEALGFIKNRPGCVFEIRRGDTSSLWGKHSTSSTTI
jgi:GNAT superfamily N-acetyltransferase